LSLAATGIADQSGEPRRTPGIEKLECRKVEWESSVRIRALDLAGQPAENLWVDAISKAHGKEQTLQIDGTGVGKLWVVRDRPYETHAHGLGFDGYRILHGVRVPLGCELQVRVTVLRTTGGPIIIY
jgi:hypothetical protein